ncbi:Shedu anti-phage system protein SduA domain-containing protein [Sunxiuqinia indica]|uniref:Shedu anti-phage system protein SduA domain-containing protein n=1 Tax=Sunxiuqinia indica TaxID=2692584 RepID=UPI00135A5746|nr:Shedu anti-phage system protein SduA domain-containing protein [Sunxiuqinia indica]
MLYERDYNILTEEEKERIEEAELHKSKTYPKLDGWSTEDFFKYHELLPQSSYFYNSLFPNNLLQIDSLKNNELNKNIEQNFVELINGEITERDILNFINNNRYYNLIGAIFQWFQFGHHKAYLFKEFEFPTTYKADYLLVGRNSGGYHFVFIELENPYGQITQKDGELGTTFRKGIKQVNDWDSWIESNFSSLRLSFEKFKSPRKELSKEFLLLDKSRLNYVVIAGRRSDFNDKTYEIKRKYLKNNNIHIMHYDNLIDAYKNLIREKNY